MPQEVEIKILACRLRYAELRLSFCLFQGPSGLFPEPYQKEGYWEDFLLIFESCRRRAGVHAFLVQLYRLQCGFHCVNIYKGYRFTDAMYTGIYRQLRVCSISDTESLVSLWQLLPTLCVGISCMSLLRPPLPRRHPCLVPHRGNDSHLMRRADDNH